VTSSEALADIRSHVTAGHWTISRHAQKRMAQRNVTMKDLRSALTGARCCHAEGTKWKVTGPDVDGDDLTCVVVLESGVVVVTVY
jgi:hypothetical protein